VLGGPDLLVLMVLALGGAMVVGNVLALVKPPPAPKTGELARAPKWRTGLMIGIGVLATVWAIASLATAN
jgi:hypothetical protein